MRPENWLGYLVDIPSHWIKLVHTSKKQALHLPIIFSCTSKSVTTCYIGVVYRKVNTAIIKQVLRPPLHSVSGRHARSNLWLQIYCTSVRSSYQTLCQRNYCTAPMASSSLPCHSMKLLP